MLRKNSILLAALAGTALFGLGTRANAQNIAYANGGTTAAGGLNDPDGSGINVPNRVNLICHLWKNSSGYLCGGVSYSDSNKSNFSGSGYWSYTVAADKSLATIAFCLAKKSSSAASLPSRLKSSDVFRCSSRNCSTTSFSQDSDR